MKKCTVCNEMKPKNIFAKRSGMCPPCLKLYKVKYTSSKPYVYFIENLNLRIGESVKTPTKRIETYLNNAFLINRKDGMSIKLRTDFNNRQDARKWLLNNFIIIDYFDTVELSKSFEYNLISNFKPSGNVNAKFSIKDIEEMKKQSENGVPHTTICKSFNCSNHTVKRLIDGNLDYLKLNKT